MRTFVAHPGWPVRKADNFAPVAASISGTSGVWTNVTPGDMTMDPDATAGGVGVNFGAQGVRADPFRPGVMYANACYQGLWKSTDYGLTWAKIAAGTNDIMGNCRGNLSVLPTDGSYIITTGLYPISGYSNGCWKSVDQGVNWRRINIGFDNGDDVGRIAAHPSNPLRMVASAHSGTDHMWESRDAGETWTDQGAMGGATSAEQIWLDDDTLLAISDGDNVSGNGTWRGVRSGSVWPWTWTWTSVDTQQHWHGTAQAFVDGTGNVWTGGGFGIRKSTNNGVTWTQVSANNSGGILATATVLYSTSNYASTAGFGPDLGHAARPAGTSWSSDTPPGGFSNGWVYGATVTDGVKWAVVGGNWNAGIWRLVE